MIGSSHVQRLPFSTLSYSTLEEGDHIHPSKTKLLPEHFGEKIAATIERDGERCLLGWVSSSWEKGVKRVRVLYCSKDTDESIYNPIGDSNIVRPQSGKTIT
jgi:hypothetical protein